MTFSSEEEQIKKFEQDIVTQEYIAILRTLIAKKSIFAQQVGLQEVAAYLKEIFTKASAEVELDDSYTAPFVIAKFKSSNPTAKTIIFYNHYDTVPADSDQIWTDDPFTLSIRDGGMYGRGVDDDKGHIIARLTAMQKYLQKHKTLPVNVIFMMEGAEESASVDLEKYLAKHKVFLQGADLLVWEQGIKNSLGQLEISGGNKGIVTFDMKVKSAEVDIHSSFGGVIDSASWYLLNALASLRGKDGCIQVEGLYDQVIAPNQRELALVEQYAQRSPEEVETIYGLELPLLQEEKKSFLNRIFFEPSLNIEGITSGYQGQGVKTILPSEASAKVEVRLVPGLEPRMVLELIRKQLDKNGFDKVELVYTLGEMSYRSDMSALPILNVIELAKKFYQEGVSVLPTTAGTGPMHTVFEALEVSMVAFGLGNANSRDHGGDENVRIADYYTHIELVEELIASYE
ncbi:M20/M25/M40 family metallo-hydrolase [Streptococcus anginosus]|uniref:M20/M25/M40 family metallo-hydrolase n=1 Tax=Streptococcus anginosus TaxID=1328 RepID=UPI001959CE17|nr:M20/M25/M40 family metallo-hydrolase [Streptococcus anginosus]VTY21701.1 Succinyl-diaminopimelate desuccinylase [Streptococcus anginosus]